MTVPSEPTRRTVLAAAAAAGTMLATPGSAQTPDPHAAAATAVPPPLTLAFEAIVDIAPTLDAGPAPLGRRRMVPILGGSFTGPRLRGVVLPGGADRQLIRPDGVRLLSAQYELRTDDGAIISVLNRVLVDDRGAGPRYAFSTLEIVAPTGPHGWLNDRVFVGTLGSLKPQRQAVRVTVWALG